MNESDNSSNHLSRRNFFRNAGLGEYDGSPKVYENDLRELLTRTKDALPDLKLIICQPFILTETSAVDESWPEYS